MKYLLHATLRGRIVWTRIVVFPYYPTKQDLLAYALLENQAYKYTWERL